MTKIVINACFGGFGLSDDALVDYARRKGLTVYPETVDDLTLLWLIPPGKERDEVTYNQDHFYELDLEDRKEANRTYSEVILSPDSIARDDPHLVTLVEEMGETSFGRFTSLKVIEIPDDVEWQLEQYDGMEWVAEKHRTWR